MYSCSSFVSNIVPRLLYRLGIDKTQDFSIYTNKFIIIKKHPNSIILTTGSNFSHIMRLQRSTPIAYSLRTFLHCSGSYPLVYLGSLSSRTKSKMREGVLYIDTGSYNVRIVRYLPRSLTQLDVFGRVSIFSCVTNIRTSHRIEDQKTLRSLLLHTMIRDTTI